MKRTKVSQRFRSEELCAALADYDQIVIVTHDNPDPDAIASGWALKRLFSRRLKREARLVGGGAVVRAENQHMMNLLNPPLELVQSLKPRDTTAVVFVDCRPHVAEHLLQNDRFDIVAVIDHHLGGKRPDLPFVDIRPRTAAAASMTAGYLREQNIKPSERLATAMLYAIRTETCGNEFHHTQQDRKEIQWLTSYANPEWLAEIQSAPLTRSYYSDMVLALQSTFQYGDAAFCLLPQAEGQEVVGEVADLLIRCDGINRIFCGAVVGRDLVCSVRTKSDDDNAAKLVQKTLDGLGFGGGHGHRAGGKAASIPQGRITETLEDNLRDRWLKACKSKRKRGTRLVAKSAIEGSLKRKSRGSR